MYTVIVLLTCVALIYGIIFPHYKYSDANIINISLFVVSIIIFVLLLLAFINAKLFENHLKSKFGSFQKTHFPSSDSIESQSYHDFKLELCKIFILIIAILGLYNIIGSPYETSVNLINSHKYNDAITMTTIWSKILPLEARWFSLRGFSKFHIQDFEGAIDDYEKAYQLENDEFKTMNFDNKIYIKYYTKNYKSALQDFDNEISIAKNEYDKDQLLWDKAQFLYNIGTYSEALNIYNKLIINSEKDSIFLIQNRLYYERAQVHKALGNEKLSQQDIIKAEELNLTKIFQNPIPKPVLLLDNIDS